MVSRIAYIMSRFPTITETFILYEILELERFGLKIEIFPLIRQDEPVKHAEVNKIEGKVHYNHVLSIATFAAQFYWLYKKPKQYLLAWWRALCGNLSSWKFFNRAMAVVPLASRIARQMQELGIEHVHAHWATHPTLAAYVIKQLTGLTYSFTAHAHDIYVERPMLREKIEQSSCVITISEYNRRFLQELYGDAAFDKTIVIRCGIDPEVFQYQTVRKSIDCFTIICIASLKDYKGHSYLLEACAQLKAQDITFRCLLVGDGNYRPQIEAKIMRLGLSEYVSLLGFQPRNRIKQLLAEADVMVLPSIVTGSGKKDGIPVALMEALAIGLPVIATSISGISELIEDGETGLLVQERDPQSITAALLKLYGSPELSRQLGVAGREKVLQEFNLYNNVSKLHHVLSQDWTNTDISAAQTIISA